MNEYVTLLGAEQVQSAANSMQQAAHEIHRAANSISESVHLQERALREATDVMINLIAALEKVAKP